MKHEGERMKRTITKREYLMLEGLLVLRDRCRDEHERIEKAVAELLDVPEEGTGYYGRVSDYMFDKDGAKELMNVLKISLKGKKKKDD